MGRGYFPSYVAFADETYDWAVCLLLNVGIREPSDAAAPDMWGVVEVEAAAEAACHT